jgi:endonuclease/exonuclease/phosphatase family metal-dependent hydrolase
MGFVEAVITTDVRTIRVYNYHAGYLRPEERILQLDHFSEIYNRSPLELGAWSGKGDIDGSDGSNRAEMPGMPKSAIVCGDFNCPPGSREYQHLMAKNDLSDCWNLADPDNLYTPTLKHARTDDIDIAGKIDHILVSADLVVKVERVDIDHNAAGSDHKPVHSFITP